MRPGFKVYWLVVIILALSCLIQGCSHKRTYVSYGFDLETGTLQSCSKCEAMGPHGSLCDWQIYGVSEASIVSDTNGFGLEPDYIFYGMPPDSTCTIYDWPTNCFDGPQTIVSRVQFDAVLAPYIDTAGICLFDFEMYNLKMAAHCGKCNAIGPHGSLCNPTVGWISIAKTK